MTKQEDKLLVRVAILLFLVGFPIILYALGSGRVLEAEVGKEMPKQQSNVVMQKSADPEDKLSALGTVLDAQVMTEGIYDIRIPYTENMKEASVSVAMDVAHHILYVELVSEEKNDGINTIEQFYKKNPVLIKEGTVHGVAMSAEAYSLSFSFVVDSAYEVVNIPVDGALELRLTKPAQMYDVLGVYDGFDEAQRNYLDQYTMGSSVGLFYNAGAEGANEIQADYYICLETVALPADRSIVDQDGEIKDGVSDKIHILYNDSFVIPGFDSAALAGLLEEYYRSVSDSAKGIEVDMEKVSDETLEKCTVPAVIIKVEATEPIDVSDWVTQVTAMALKEGYKK
ncbi:MAG: hypothetical protein K6G07_03755 [Lachnospiraceae bacterium]|nr:hypothetical protein [Lachnospiraceae bacterium]